MRIFLIMSPSGNSSVPGSMTWYNNFYETLVDLKHEVFLLRKDLIAQEIREKIGSEKYKSIFSQKLLDVFKSEHSRKPFDIFLAYLKEIEIDPVCITEIKRSNLPTLNFSCNNTHQFYLVENIAPYFDYNLYSEKNAKEKFDSIGANSIWFPMAANPKYYYPIITGKIYDVSFIGASYAKRAYYINHLLENDINVHCFGPNWLINKPYHKIKRGYKEIKRYFNLVHAFLSLSTEKRLRYSSAVREFDFQTKLRLGYKQNLHYPVNDKEMIKIYSQSYINLGFLEVYASDNLSHQSLKQHIHLREFEIPMSGGLYFTNFSDELAEFYVPDKEIVVFRNEYELLDKIKYYLSHENEAEKIRRAGYERAITSHTYHLRFKKLFDELKL